MQEGEVGDAVEKVSPLSEISTSATTSISDYKFVKVSVGINFRIEDVTGILSISIPELPIWFMDRMIPKDSLEKAKGVAKEKAKAAKDAANTVKGKAVG